MACGPASRQRIPAELGGGPAAARLPRDGGTRAPARSAAPGRSDLRGRGAHRAADPRLRACALAAHVRPAPAPRARRGRVVDRCRRRALPRLLQQRAGRRTCASSGDRRHRAPVAPAQHQHALLDRRAGRARRAAGRDDARGFGPRYRAVRQLRERSQRHGVAAPDGPGQRDRGPGPAWRLATAWTSGRGALVTRFAYHGVTESIAAISPEEWLATGRPDHVETFDPPDRYRERDGDMPAALTAAAARLRGRGVDPAATFVDGGFTSDGIPVPPVDAVCALADRSHDAGALYVAGEVQIGHGRGGDHLCSFPAQPVAADVVTLGKPMG